MKKNLSNWMFLGICLIAVTCLTSCGGGPSSTNHNNPPSSGTLLAPTNVVAVRESGGLRISWTGVAGAESYKLLRKEGNGDFATISDSASQIRNTSWVENKDSYPEDKTIQYAVIAHRQSEFSAQSEPSNSIAEWVQDIKASKMKFSNKIVLNWSVHPEGLCVYRIYCDGNRIIETSDNSYSDESLNSGTMHSYRVTWVKDGEEHGTNVPLVYGVCSSTTEGDTCEDNDDQEHATLLTKQAPKVTAYAYVYQNGNNDFIVDTDWYCYQRENTSVPEQLPIEINVITLLYNQILILRFADNLSYQGKSLGSGANRIDCKFPAGVDKVYFKIEPEIVNSELGIGEYTIQLQ